MHDTDAVVSPPQDADAGGRHLGLGFLGAKVGPRLELRLFETLENLQVRPAHRQHMGVRHERYRFFSPPSFERAQVSMPLADDLGRGPLNEINPPTRPGMPTPDSLPLPAPLGLSLCGSMRAQDRHAPPDDVSPSNTEPENGKESDLGIPDFTKALRTQGELRKNSSVSSRVHSCAGFRFSNSSAPKAATTPTIARSVE